MIKINITLFIQMANFLVFLVLMNLVLYRPIRKVVAERRKLVSERQEKIEELEAQAKSSLLEYDRRLQDARRSGSLRIQELKAAGYEQEKELLRQISEQTALRVQELRGKIEKDIAAARKELKLQVKAFSVELAQKILGRKI